MVGDSAELLIWEQWGGDWRDVFILNKQNEIMEVYNLTEHNLNDPSNYTELKEKLIAAAQSE